MVDYNGVATTTEYGGELRQKRVRCCGLPSWNSGQWGTSGVAGVTVVLLRWRRSSEDELPSAMALAALVREWLQRRARKKAEETKNGAWKGSGGRWRFKAAPRRSVACADRPAATRGRFPRHAARGV